MPSGAKVLKISEASAGVQRGLAMESSAIPAFQSWGEGYPGESLIIKQRYGTVESHQVDPVLEAC